MPEWHADTSLHKCLACSETPTLSLSRVTKFLLGGPQRLARAVYSVFTVAPITGFLCGEWNVARKAAIGNCSKRLPKLSYSVISGSHHVQALPTYAFQGCVSCVDGLKLTRCQSNCPSEAVLP